MIIIEGSQKWELTDMGGWYNVSLSELMDEQWIKIGPAEAWSKTEVIETFKEVM